MPDVTVVVWNVETFGDAWPAVRGGDYTPICRFMAQALYEVKADVFIMMELRRGGAQYLPTLKAALEAQPGAAAQPAVPAGPGVPAQSAVPAHVWNYDYIPGSVLPPFGDPVGPASFDYTQQGHGEGYAVLWRNQPDFTVLRTRNAFSRNIVGGESKIGLVLQGRTPTTNVPRPLWYQAPNFDPAAPPAAWTRLGFPAATPPLQGQARWNLSRRPCYVVLGLNRPGPPERRLLPIVVHHSTSPNPLRNPRSTPWSVQLAAYSAQLYQVDDTSHGATTMVTVEQALAAGDFNIDHNEATSWQREAYDYFTNDFGPGGANDGGANLPTTWVDSANAPDNHTAVRLSRWHGPKLPPEQITAANVDAYRWLAIDNLFIRDLPTVNPPAPYRGPVYNVLSGLQAGGFLVDTPAKQAVIRSFRDAVLAALGAPHAGGGGTNYPYIGPANTPCRTRKRKTDGTYSFSAPVIGNLMSYTDYMADLQLGHFTSARRAAEFYVNSISDHLPLVYRFTV
ncbi:endonuclease/exonuclease/phosphatase family protein [Streptomyces sp. NPDC005474]|uniref:endonuclease/exonuclease/phosphatase family protein n=1 Tax=Streptomyces sp. NPDC005474 TaxID=3154878 RepID=UPI0034533F4C